MRTGDLLTVRQRGRLVNAVLLGVDDGRDHPYEMLILDELGSHQDFLSRGAIVKNHGPVGSKLRTLSGQPGSSELAQVG